MRGVECADCGLTPGDLPDGVDPEFVFERGDDGVMRCQGCAINAADRMARAER